MIAVPSVDPALGFVLSAMAGHLFGYEAALAIDASARPLREVMEVIERAAAEAASADARARRGAPRDRPPVAERTSTALRGHRYDGHLEASTAVRLAGLLRDVRSDRPVEEYQASTGKVGSPAALVDDLVLALTRAIEELTRPVDAIKHQAKTVTVGISRSDEGVMDRALVQAVLDAGAGRDVLSYRTLKVLADLDPAVAEVTGFTRYGIDGDTIIDRRPRRHLPADRQPRRPQPGARRHQAPRRQRARGARRPRPQRRAHGHLRARGQGRHARPGITLLHVRFHDRLDAPTMRGVLVGLRPPLRPPRRLGDGDRGRRSTIASSPSCPSTSC